MNHAQDFETKRVPMGQIVIGIVVLLLVGVFGGAQAQTTCPGVTMSPSTFEIDYDPLTTADTTATFQVNGGSYSSNNASTYGRSLYIVKQALGSEDEAVRYSFDNVSGLDFGFNSVARLSELGLNWRGSDLKEVSVRRGDARPSIVPSATFRATIEKLQMLPARRKTVSFAAVATYNQLDTTALCQFSTRDWSGGIAFSEESFTLNVTSAVAISLVGGGTSGTINFDQELATAAKRSIGIQLRANVPYKVTMDSAYNGVLKLNNVATTNEQIAYTATLGGTPISETTQFVSSAPDGTGAAGISVPFEITMGNTSNARAGYYKDTIILTIANPV